MRRRSLAAYGITPYRVTIALSNDEWAKLKAEAERNGQTGTRLIENILVDVCSVLPAPSPEPVPEPPPPDEGDELEQVE